MSTRTGPLDPVKLFKIFRSLLEQQLTGHLVFTRGQIVKRLRVMNGLPVRVVSNARRESALAALQEQGFLTAEDVERVGQARDAQRVTAEEALVKLGYLDWARLRTIENRLARRRLLEVFTWREGEYTFTPATFRAEPEDESIDLISLLVEAGAKVTPEDECRKFCEQFGGQLIRLTAWAETYAAPFDAAFGSPNIRHTLARPSSIDELIGQLRDADRVRRQVFTLIIGGLGVFQKLDTGIRPSSSPQTGPMPVRPVSASQTGPLPMRGAPVSAPPPAATPAPRVVHPESTPSPRGVPPHPTPSSRPVVMPARPTAPVGPVTMPEPPSPPAAPPQPTRAPKPLDDKGRAGLAEVERVYAVMRKQTHYELLGVPKEADIQAIRTQYRKLARDFHVDRFTRYGLSPEVLKKVQEVFMSINRAHEVLADPEKRKEYDLQVEMAARGQRVPSGAGGGADMGAIFRAETLVRDGVMLLRNGNAAGAKVKFDEALVGSPADVVARAGLAFAEFLIAHGAGKNGDAEKARHALEEIVHDNTSRDEPFLYLGRVYRTRNDIPKAVAMFKRALDVNPRCAEAASELRHLQRKQETTTDKSQSGLFGRKKA